MPIIYLIQLIDFVLLDSIDEYQYTTVCFYMKRTHSANCYTNGAGSTSMYHAYTPIVSGMPFALVQLG